ncbi:FERM, ARHGEF and pleckstrin domain-containing protein 2, partial [Erethizon dorsatum]
QEEYTRYLLALQLKRDLLEERLTCAATTAALLTSHLLQAEIGDYDETLDREHLKANVYLPSQEQALEKILAFHQRHTGQTPAESDFQVLEIARKLEMYGIRFHTASDREGTKINLAVSHMGVLVFQGTTKINTFNWSKVRKLSFKRKRFLIKLHPEVHGPYQDTLEFLLGSRDECKNFWKICVEYHTFFRRLDQPKPKAKAVFFSRGSSFRYSGRTQKQLVDYIKDGGMKRIPYERWHSKTRISIRALTADLPEQPDFKDSSGSLEDPQAPCISSAAVKNVATRRSSGAAEGPGFPSAQPSRSPALQFGPGVGFCPVVSSHGSVCPTGQSLSALDLDVGRAGGVLRAASGNDIGEDDIPPSSLLSSGAYQCGQQRHGGGPVFTLTNAQLQVSEEFIDDDPADISFFAGGSEAFSFPYSPLVPPEPQALAQPPASPPLQGPDAFRHPESAQSSPDRYSTEAVDMNVEDEFEFGEGSDFNGNAHPSDTSELFEVKAQAILMQSLLSPSDTSSLRNNQSENSSLHNLPLHGGLSLHTSSSANQSEASSMVNFPAYSVHSESSSAFQFSDIIDQLEQLSYPPTTVEDSSSTDSSSWGSETEAPLDMSLFFSLAVDSPQPSPSSQKSPRSLSPAFQVALGPAERGSSPLLSPVLSDAGGNRTEDQEEPRHKGFFLPACFCFASSVRTSPLWQPLEADSSGLPSPPTSPKGQLYAVDHRVPEDEAYFIAKEILATERTYLKDLEVITVWFRSAVVKENAMPAALMTLLFSNIDPVYEFHRGFLHEVEHRLALWEGLSITHTKDDHQRIGDILLRNMRQLKEFTSYFQRHDEVLTELEKATKCYKKLEAVYKEFELQKVCYLPLNTFLLKPIQRLVHYRLLLSRLCRHYTPGHRDYADCCDALKAITEVTATLQHSLIRLENLQKLTELQRDLVGVENLIAPGREFIREGCLHKLTKKGLQQRMFFLFSDMLLYTSKGVTGSSQFRIRGLLPLHGMLVEESENEWSVPHCFTIYAAQKTIVVAASTRLEKEKWMLDLNAAIQVAKSSRGSTSEVMLEQKLEDTTQGPGGSLEGQGQHRANTTMHVCWYRHTSVSRADHSAAVENQLSGYLLRKFKNTNGWQKLWVVFTNFCLFFYKTHQDDHPLASLPLLGYSVSIPREADGIHKDYVFKLQFKSHVYYFRAESKYTFERWMEVIERASSSRGAPSPAQDSLQPCSGLEGALKGKE